MKKVLFTLAAVAFGLFASAQDKPGPVLKFGTDANNLVTEVELAPGESTQLEVVLTEQQETVVMGFQLQWLMKNPNGELTEAVVGSNEIPDDPDFPMDYSWTLPMNLSTAVASQGGIPGNALACSHPLFATWRWVGTNMQRNQFWWPRQTFVCPISVAKIALKANADWTDEYATFEFDQDFYVLNQTPETTAASMQNYEVFDMPEMVLKIKNKNYAAPDEVEDPVINFAEENGVLTVTVRCATDGATLYVNGVQVEGNPYTYTVTQADPYTEETVNVEAYAVNGTATSQTVKDSFTFTAQEKPVAEKATMNVDVQADKVVVNFTPAQGTTITVNGEALANPYEYERPAWDGEAYDVIFAIVASGTNMQDYAYTEVVTIAPQAKPEQTAQPTFEVTNDDNNYYVTARGNGHIVLLVETEGGDTYTAEGEDYADVTLPRSDADYIATAIATAQAEDELVSESAETTFTVLAKEQAPQPGEGNIYVKFNGTELPVGKKIIFVYENGANSYSMGTVSTKADPVAVEVVNGEVDIEGKGVTEFTVGGGEVAFGTDIKQYTLEYSAGFLAYNSSTNFKTLTSIGTYDNDAYWRLQTGDNGYVLNNAATASRYIRKHATTNKFGPYAKNTDSEEVVIYIEKSDEPALQDLAGHISFGEPTADGKVAVSYNGEEEGVVVTVEGYEVVDGMIQLPEYGTYTLTATATAEGYNDLTEEGEVTWNAPVLPTLGGYFVWSALDENGHFTVAYNNFDYDGDYTLVVKDENGNVMELDADGEYYQAAEGTHTYTAEVTAAGYQPKSENHEYTYTVPTYAPAPVLNWNEETFTMTATLENRAYSNEDIELYMNENKVENPKTVAQTYTEQTLNFKARTIGKDGDNNSEWVYKTVTVPAKEMQDSQTPVITVTPGEETYTISATPCTELLIDGVEQTNPYTVARPAVGEEDLVIYVTAINNDGEGYKDATATQRVVIPAKQPAQQQCAKPDGGYVNGQDFHGVTVTLTNNETAEGTQLHYTVKKDGVVITEDAIYDGPFALTQNGEYEIDFWATAPGMLDSTHGGLKFTIDETTGLSELAAGKNVASVRYFNMAGQEMQEANGMTIVVTTYTDGTSSAVKVMK